MAPELKAQWGGIKPTIGRAVWRDEETEEKYYSCPLLFVTHSIRAWYQEYAYTESHTNTAPPYRDQNAKYNDARIVYESAYQFFQSVKPKAGKA